MLVRGVGALRHAVRATMAARPFHVDAWVVGPDHMHAVWTLPEGDAGCGVRWGAIEAGFSLFFSVGSGSTPPIRTM